MLAEADAALVIGDIALRVAIAAETHVTRGPDVEWLTEGATVGISAIPQLHIYDVVKEWWHLAEKPAVLAVWAARNDAFPENGIPEEVVSDFLTSRDFGLAHLPEICVEAAQQMDLPEKELLLYLEKNIDFSLDPENLQGLQRLWALSSDLGLIPSLHPATFAGPPASRAVQRA
jgi:predicted solute-binding protein